MIEHIKTKNPVPVGKRIPMDRGAPYLCPELKRNPGIDDARFEAFRLPSRVGERYDYPKRIP